MKIRTRRKLSIPSIALSLYFILFISHNILFDNAFINYLWYAILIICFSIGVIWAKLSISKEIAIYFFIFIVSTIVNVIIVGNASLIDIVFAFFYLGIYSLLCDDRIEQKYLEVTIYICCAILSLSMLRAGVGIQVFADTSVNFVSVYLFVPTVVYYVRAEYYKSGPKILPAIGVAITCLLAIGRSGIITAAFLLVSIIWYVAFVEKSGKQKNVRFFIRFGLIVVLIGVLAYLFSSPRLLQSNVYLQRFSRYGMYGTGRRGIWGEYFSTVKKSFSNVAWGVKFSDLSLMDKYNDNLHNSFLDIHACSGIFVLGYILVIILLNIKICINKKRWIYLTMIIVIFARAFTDIVFVAGSATTSILFLLMWFIRQKNDYKDNVLIGL